MTHDVDISQAQPSNEKTKKEIIITDKDALTIAKKLRIGRTIVFVSYLSLILVFMLLNLLSEKGNIKLWLVQTVPMLIFVPMFFKETHRLYSWLCFVTLMYFVAIVPMLMSRWLWSDWLITLLVTCLFIASMMTSRWLQYWNYYLSKKNQNTPT